MRARSRRVPAHHEGLWPAFTRSFAALPLCAVTSHTAIMHGGVPSDAMSLDDLDAITSEQVRDLPTSPRGSHLDLP